MTAYRNTEGICYEQVKVDPDSEALDFRAVSELRSQSDRAVVHVCDLVLVSTNDNGSLRFG